MSNKVTMGDFSNINKAVSAGLSEQTSAINKLDIDQSQKDLMIYQAKQQQRQLLTSTITQIMKSQYETSKEVARNL